MKKKESEKIVSKYKQNKKFVEHTSLGQQTIVFTFTWDGWEVRGISWKVSRWLWRKLRKIVKYIRHPLIHSNQFKNNPSLHSLSRSRICLHLMFCYFKILTEKQSANNRRNKLWVTRTVDGRNLGRILIY